MQNQIDVENETRIRAIAKIEDYLLHSRSPLTIVEKVLISLAVILLFAFSIIIYVVKKKSSNIIINQEKSLIEKDNIITEQIQYEKDRIDERKQVVEDNIVFFTRIIIRKFFCPKERRGTI